MSELILNDGIFNKEVVESNIPILVDFWAPWCGPCRMQGPIVEELAKETDKDKAKVAKLNVDENPVSAGQYNVMSIPTLLIFKNGQVVERFVGVQSKDVLKNALAKHQ
ncbi:MAG: thioredoxin [Patescibacteria group bacterium]